MGPDKRSAQDTRRKNTVGRPKDGSKAACGNVAVSGGAEYKKSMAGERIVSDNAKNPRPSSVTAEDYADYLGSFKGADRSGSSRRGRPVQRGRNVVSGKNGSGRTGFESAATGSTMHTVLKKYLSRRKVRLIVSAFAALMAGILVYHTYLGIYVRYKTEEVRISTYMETIDVEGIAIREETVIDGTLSKTSVKTVQNGDKVSKGEAIVNTFSSAQEAAAFERIAEIDKEIEELESMVSASEDTANVVDNIGKLLDNEMVSLNGCSVQKDLSDIPDSKREISYLLNKRLVAMKQVEGYETRIEQLEQEKAALEKNGFKNPKTVKAPSSGYFADSCDGYENLLTASMVPDLTVDKLDEIMKEEVSAPEKVIGKLVGSFTWYLACPVPSAEADTYLTQGMLYTLHLPYSETEKIQATLAYLNKVEGQSKYLAVFRCNSLASELCTVRSQPVRIQKCAYEGYIIKKSALHAGIKDEIHKNPRSEDDFPRAHLVYVTQTTYPSVYTIVAGQISEKEVDIVYSTDKLVICSPRHNDRNYLSLYDTVVIEERGLYDGKLVN